MRGIVWVLIVVVLVIAAILIFASIGPDTDQVGEPPAQEQVEEPFDEDLMDEETQDEEPLQDDEIIEEDRGAIDEEEEEPFDGNGVVE